jgi:hypothetical protein
MAKGGKSIVKEGTMLQSTAIVTTSAQKVDAFLNALSVVLGEREPKQDLELGGLPKSQYADHLLIHGVGIIWVFPNKRLTKLEILVQSQNDLFDDNDRKQGTKMKCTLCIAGMPLSQISALVRSEFNRITRELNSAAAEKNRLLNSVRREKAITIARLDAGRARFLGESRTELLELVANLGWLVLGPSMNPDMSLDAWSQMSIPECRKYVRDISKAFAKVAGGVSFPSASLELAWKRQGIDPCALWRPIADRTAA